MSDRMPQESSFNEGSDSPRHLVIRASAGSGKTYRLAVRYIGVLCRSSSDQILATTFTRKAAGEILGRVLNRLAQASLNDKAARRLADEIAEPSMTRAKFAGLLKTLCRSLHRVAISTIDSFFNKMAMSFRHELDIPAGTRLLDANHPVIVQVRRRAIEALLTDAPPRVMLDLLQRLHHDSRQRSVTRAIESIVSDLHGTYRQAPDRETWNIVGERPELSNERLMEAIEKMEALDDPVFKDGRWLASHKQSIEKVRQGQWKEFCSVGIGAKIAENEAVFNRKEIPEGVRDVYQPLVDHGINSLVNTITHATAATYELIRRYDLQMTDLLRQHRLMTFTDIPDKLVRRLPMLDEDVRMEVYFRLDAKVQHLLLDEFQDTSPQQWDVLRPFAQEIISYGDRSRSFFCVGDTKQAIYGWRGGCAELFDQIEAELNLDPESIQTLSKSFRSAQAVLDGVNRVFSTLDQFRGFDKLASVAEAWRDDFEDHTAGHPELKGYVELVATEESDEDEEKEDYVDESDRGDPGEQVIRPVRVSGHMQFVARRIQEIHARTPGKTIGVLVGTNKRALEVLDLLRSLNIRASGEGGNPVNDDGAVNAILAAMTLADHPGDSAAAFHVLYSALAPVVGIKSMSPAHRCEVALRIRSRLAVEGYAAVIAGWASDERVVAACDSRNRTRLGHLVELAERHDLQPSLRPNDFVRFVGMSMVEEPGNVPVRVMTIHKSKGLEFDIVVMPELEKRLGDVARQAACITRDTPTGPITGVFRATNAFVREQCGAFEEAYQQEAKRRLQDEICTLYVGMTRARHALHLFVRPRGVSKSGEPKKLGFSFAGILRSRLADDTENDTGERRTLYAHGDPEWAGPVDETNLAVEVAPAPEVRRFVVGAGTRAAGRSMQVKSPSSLEAGGKVKVQDLLMLKPSQARTRGSVIHAWFEAVEFIDDRWALPEAMELDRLARIGSPEATEAELAGWRTAYAGMVKSSAIRLALARPAMDDGESVSLWREREFVARVGDELLRGVFDRVVIVYGPDGRALRAMLIDFKTDTVSPGAGPGSLETIVRMYRPQIEAYCRALAVMLGLTSDQVRAMLLFVGAGLAVEINRR